MDGRHEIDAETVSDHVTIEHRVVHDQLLGPQHVHKVFSGVLRLVIFNFLGLYVPIGQHHVIPYVLFGTDGVTDNFMIVCQAGGLGVKRDVVFIREVCPKLL